LTTYGPDGLEIANYKCGCPPNFEDDVDLITGAVRRCGKCRRGWFGPNCDLPIVRDEVLCSNLTCPRGTQCFVFTPRNMNTATIGCYCPDGRLWSEDNPCDFETNDGDDKPNPCATVRCIANSECVVKDNSVGAACVCKSGYVMSTDAVGNPACLPISTDCSLNCPDDQICINVPDFSFDTLAIIPRCVCKNPHTVLINGTCQCRDGWTGRFCHIPFNPCELYADKCPPRSKCVPDPTSINGGYQCVCDGSFTGVNCNENLCSQKNCDFAYAFWNEPHPFVYLPA
jgi:hypothetical protein